MHKLGTNIALSPINSPCKDCKERYLACSDRCLKYAEFRIKLDKYNNRIKRQKEEDWECLSSAYSLNKEHKYTTH